MHIRIERHVQSNCNQPLSHGCFLWKQIHVQADGQKCFCAFCRACELAQLKQSQTYWCTSEPAQADIWAHQQVLAVVRIGGGCASGARHVPVQLAILGRLSMMPAA